MEYKILYKDGRAKRAEMKTVHGTIQTPIYELGSPDPHGFRRISGVFPGRTAED